MRAGVLHCYCHRPQSPCFFFFQAEDGIRDLTVTGVQTCALPISLPPRPVPGRLGSHYGARRHTSRTNNKRSEEHTSELQSQSNLVCRLLLEKKKKDIVLDPCPAPSATTTRRAFVCESQ